MDPVKKLAELDARKKALSLFGEFKAFAFKGNVLDMAVGVIIGAAFGKIVSSLVDNVIMPIIGHMLPGDKGYQNWAPGGVKVGLFIGDVLTFLIVAAVVFFMVVKFLGWLLRSKTQEVVTPPPLTKDQELLAEIRDLLRTRGETAATATSR
jgi:large conductance mechanosensitive channel